jgi:hypothetical protein
MLSGPVLSIKLLGQENSKEGMGRKKESNALK